MQLAYPFVHEMPFVTLLTGPVMDPRTSAILGNVFNPSFVFTPVVQWATPMTRWERAKNLFAHSALAFLWRSWMIVPAVQAEVGLQRAITFSHTFRYTNMFIMILKFLPIYADQQDLP